MVDCGLKYSGERVSQILLLTAIYLCPLLDAPVRMVINPDLIGVDASF